MAKTNTDGAVGNVPYKKPKSLRGSMYNRDSFGVINGEVGVRVERGMEEVLEKVLEMEEVLEME